jgi:NADP-dependent 3-hydroxy acid dehydrogenase YdfG
MSWRIFNTRSFGGSKIMISSEEVEQHVIEYPVFKDDDIVDVLRGRVNYAVWDQIHCMINNAGFTNPKEVEKMILSDIKMYIDSFAEKQVSVEDLK